RLGVHAQGHLLRAQGVQFDAIHQDDAHPGECIVIELAEGLPDHVLPAHALASQRDALVLEQVDRHGIYSCCGRQTDTDVWPLISRAASQLRTTSSCCSSCASASRQDALNSSSPKRSASSPRSSQPALSVSSALRSAPSDWASVERGSVMTCMIPAEAMPITSALGVCAVGSPPRLSMASQSMWKCASSSARIRSRVCIGVSSTKAPSRRRSSPLASRASAAEGRSPPSSRAARYLAISAS